MDDARHRRGSRRGALEHLEEHPVRDAEARDERLGLRVDEPLERRPVPVHVALVGRLLAHDPLQLHGVAPGLRLEPQVLDDVLGRLRDDEPPIVEALASRAPGDLLEVAHAEDRRLLAVELAELREEHGADRDVHAHAERVRPADDREKPLLRELLDEEPVLRQQPRVVDADAVREEALHLLAVGRVEAHARRAPRRWRFFRSFGQKSMLMQSCAVSAAARWVKLTT